MRKFSILLLCLLLVSAASAELLVTANPIGQGKWAVLGAYLSDNNVGSWGTTTLTAATVAGYVGYGLTDKLDLYINGGQATAGNIPVAGVSSTLMAYGLNLKYQLLAEGDTMPVSVAGGIGYKSMTAKMTGMADTTGSETMVGVGVSKMFLPFIPYGGVAYRSDTSSGTTTTKLDITAGSAIAWSSQGAVFIEYTNQSVTPPAGAATYTNGQIGLGVGYVI